MGITLDRHSYLGSQPENAYDVSVTVGKYCSLAHGLVILGGSGQHAPVENRGAVSSFPFRERMHLEYPPANGLATIEIGHDVWIGAHVILLGGITIGNGAIIGAGSVVTKSVEPYAVMAGNPAVMKRLRFTPKQIARLQRIAWWNWMVSDLEANIGLMTDIDAFLETHDQQHIDLLPAR